MKLRNALLAATILAAPVAAFAQPVDGLYIGAGAGGNILQTEAVHRGPAVGFGRGSDLRFNVGPVVVGSIGYGVSSIVPGLRFELQGAGYENKIKGLKNGGAGGVPTSSGGDEYKYGVFANVLYDIPLNSFGFNSPLFPYVGAGVGYVHNQFNNGHFATVGANGAVNRFLRTTGQNDNLGVQGIVGVSFPVYDYVPGLAFTAEYRFMGEIGGRSYKDQYYTTPAVKIGGKFRAKARMTSTTASCWASAMPSTRRLRPRSFSRFRRFRLSGSGPHLLGVLRLGSCGPDGPRPADHLRGGAGQHACSGNEHRSARQRGPFRHARLQPAPVAPSCSDGCGRVGA